MNKVSRNYSGTNESCVFFMFCSTTKYPLDCDKGDNSEYSISHIYAIMLNCVFYYIFTFNNVCILSLIMAIFHAAI